jgi:hypothetical protein
MVGVGSIVSVGGTGGGGGGGSTSGLQILNGQTGPTIVLVGTSGIVIAPVADNIINIGFAGSATQSGVFGVNGIDVEQVGGNFIIDGASLSGLITPSGGIGSINGQIGPAIEIAGVNGITVTVSAENEILINGAASSGTLCYSESFTSVTSVTATHNLGSTDLVINVFDASDNQMFADRVGIVDLNNAVIEFNTPQTGKVVIVACISDVSATELLCEAKRYALLVS